MFTNSVWLQALLIDEEKQFYWLICNALFLIEINNC